jgi:hypothetical protein
MSRPRCAFLPVFDDSQEQQLALKASRPSPGQQRLTHARSPGIAFNQQSHSCELDKAAVKLIAGNMAIAFAALSLNLPPNQAQLLIGYHSPT